MKESFRLDSPMLRGLADLKERGWSRRDLSHSTMWVIPGGRSMVVLHDLDTDMITGKAFWQVDVIWTPPDDHPMSEP